jgi:4-hydroxybenzoate polyprenyltransferase
LPSWWSVLLILVAFVAARNAGHSFNRWADRTYDAANPRTQNRALVTGARTPAFALGLAVANATILFAAAYLLNPLALVLAPVALALVIGYSYTKRFTAWTTVFLGLVEAVVPAAVYIALLGRLPSVVLLASAALVLWGTAFETIHSVGDIESDRRLGLHSLPIRLGARRASVLVPVLHGGAIALFAYFGSVSELSAAYFLALIAMSAVTAFLDLRFFLGLDAPRASFRLHFVASATYLIGAVFSVFPLFSHFTVLIY